MCMMKNVSNADSISSWTGDNKEEVDEIVEINLPPLNITKETILIEEVFQELKNKNSEYHNKHLSDVIIDIENALNNINKI